MATWKKVETTAPDPLAHFANKPIISDAGSDMQYAGRVIIEIWDRVGTAAASASDDAKGLAIMVDARDGNAAALTTRVAAALPVHISQVHRFGA
jgi:hypothetical protein